MIQLSAEQTAAIIRHAEAEYPDECCGAVVGRIEKENKMAYNVLPISNTREDSEKYHRFLIRPEEYLMCEKTARKQGWDIIGFYHSHPDHPAEPSQYDLDHAFPVYSYIIVSVLKGKADKMTSWELSPDRTRFNEELLAGGL
jgi:proteasome lid subunit RPN8/RPN11